MNTINYRVGMWVLSPTRDIGTLSCMVQNSFNFLPIWARPEYATFVPPHELRGYRPVAIQRGDWILYDYQKYQVDDILLDGNNITFRLLSAIGSITTLVSYKDVMGKSELIERGYGF